MGPRGNGRADRDERLTAFEHTHLGVYFVGCFSAVCLFTDSSQGIMEKYSINKKWFLLFGFLCFFAYLYIQPLIRRRIGSAARGHINFGAVYICWLCGAVFYHLPSLQELGVVDLKTDVSMLLSTFLCSITVIAALHFLHRLGVATKMISPFLLAKDMDLRQVLSAMFLNAMSLAVACSTYYSFCGNAATDDLRGNQYARGTDNSWDIKQRMCKKWLHPVASEDFPLFKQWVIYGEGSYEGNSNGTIQIDFPLDGRGYIPVPAEKMISPVFTLWITLFTMYLVNCIADHVAVQTMCKAQDVRTLRGKLPEPVMCGLQSGKGAMEYSRTSGLLRTVSSFKNLTSLARTRNVNRETRTGFLPMVPWYCGTSADLVKVFIDLAVSLKLFLGRFDMRTMQAATSPSWCDRPHHGDGFTYEQFDDQEELFFDFCADTGDGGNSTYTVARALAAPTITATQGAEADGTQKTISLPRGSLLLIGGDLAYPGPSQETYEQRLFRPFQAALPGPPQDAPGRLVVHKPDLPQGEHCCIDSPHRCSASPSHSSLRQLRQYDGPQCFAIPGNHDWSDGLQTFIRDILHRGWLGGWLLPQEKSYFALKLPHGWWMFGVDLALECDIDMCQYRYFTRVIEQCLGADSQVIVMSHQPIWFENWFMCQPDRAAPKLKQLIREQLHGRARVHLAGDLHFFMRHSLVPVKTSSQSLAQNGRNGSNRTNSMEQSTAMPSCGTTGPREKKNGKGKPSATCVNGQGGFRNPRSNGYENEKMEENGRSKCRNGIVHRASLPKCLSDESNNVLAKEGMGACDTDTRVDCKQSMADTTFPNSLDPEHLIVNGLGGAFLHPVHVFCGASFEAQLGSSVPGLGGSLYSKGRSAELGTAMGNGNESAPQSGGYRGEYQCQAAYPPPPQSVRLGRDNLFRFRWKNTRFDVVGALWYFLLVYSVIPRCSSVAAILEAPNFLEASHQFLFSFFDMLHAIFSESYVSLMAVLVMLAVTYCFTIKGGVGVAQPSSQWNMPGGADHWLRGFRGPLKGPAERGFRVRTGGVGMQLLFASMHTMAHLSLAVILMLVLEMGVVTCIRFEAVGQEGYHSLYSWFVSSLDTHFPDPMGLRHKLEKTTLGVYPKALKYMMAVFDIPEVVAVAHIDICKTGSWESLTRLQTLGYLLGILAYYWVLAAPATGLVLGVYFYVCCQFFNVHYDEAFSALRIQNHKGFSRLHITPAGDLKIYTLAVDVVPRSWREDPAWRGPEGGGDPRGPPHRARRPSRWLPNWEACDEGGDRVEFKVVDYVFVPRRKGGKAGTGPGEDAGGVLAKDAAM